MYRILAPPGAAAAPGGALPPPLPPRPSQQRGRHLLGRRRLPRPRPPPPRPPRPRPRPPPRPPRGPPASEPLRRAPPEELIAKSAESRDRTAAARGSLGILNARVSRCSEQQREQKDGDTWRRHHCVESFCSAKMKRVRVGDFGPQTTWQISPKAQTCGANPARTLPRSVGS